MRLTPALAVAACLAASPAFAQHGDHAPPAPDPHAGHGDMPMDDAATDEPAPEQEPVILVHGMQSALGPYFMSRDGSGTSWIPETHFKPMLMKQVGDWAFMDHAALNAVYVDQGGPRGGDKAFVSGMVGAMAMGELGPGKVQFRAMLSPDPFMGKSGYPLLLAAGETADGAETLIDRQHPHDLFMELSASYSLPLGDDASVFLYGGLPGEPAFGPPAFMHRPSGMDSPEAPITHHWLDSTHVTFGVVTAGLVWKDVKLDASAFNGREPDEDRFDIETGELDSRAVRLTYNPTHFWSLQASWASIESPEALEPNHDERRFSASVMHGRWVGRTGFLALTAAWARKDKVPGDVLDAALLEASLAPNDRWTVFGRAEQVEQDELGVHHGPAYTVRKASVGAIRDFKVTEHVKVGVGALVSAFDIEAPLGGTYDDPAGGMAFVRLKIG